MRPIPAATLLIASLALLVSACSSGGGAPQKTVTKTGSAAAAPVAPAAESSSSASPTVDPNKPVHIKTLNSDGATYGVGMPIIAFFSRKITSGKDLQDKTEVTVNGQPLTAKWYFEYSKANKGFPIEGHLRPEHYWPAHKAVHVDIPAKGLSAGKGLEFENSLTLDFKIGSRHVVTVDDSSHTVSLVSDGKKAGKYPTSLGASNTRTRRGIKVIMEKGRSICMKGPGYNECGVKDTQRLTYDGEYLHSAPWNVSNIQSGVDSSNGCTNLLPNDANTLYHKLNIGDVVTYPNANGPQMQLGEGYGDWNVSWGEWQSGGLVATT